MVRQAPKRGEPYEIVFVDWQMPGLDGIETSKRILALPDLATPPRLVMVTAYGREEVLKQAEENGFENVLIKPVTSSTLFDTIVAVLRADRETTGHVEAVLLSRSLERAERACCWSRTTRSTRKSRWGCWRMPRFKSIWQRMARLQSGWRAKRLRRRADGHADAGDGRD